jgi:hypothetical protein
MPHKLFLGTLKAIRMPGSWRGRDCGRLLNEAKEQNSSDGMHAGAPGGDAHHGVWVAAAGVQQSGSAPSFLGCLFPVA